MSLKYPRLYLRNHTYYIRAYIPRQFQYLLHKKEFRFSLNTNSYFDAIKKLRLESFRIDAYIKILEGVDMEIKDGKLVFDDVDIERVCLNRLKQADKYFDENYIEIKGGRANYKDISIDPEAYEATKDYFNIPPYSKRKVLTAENVSKYIAEYLQHLLDDKNTDISILKVLNQLKTEDFSDVLNKETLEKIRNALFTFERHIYYSFGYMAGIIPQPASGRDPRIKKYIHIIEDEKKQELTAPIKSKTKWSDLFDDFAEYKRGFKKITETTINQNRGYLETVFYLMKNPVLEDITYKHCLTVCKLISKVPLRWKDRFNNASLLKLVNEVDEKGYETLSTASIRNHLMTFKEFLRFAKKRRYITEAFEYDIDIPKKEKGKERESFSGSELVKIFNVRTYPNKDDIYHFHRYWIPLIALFTGMRLNEICQLFVGDIQKKKNIYYFNVTDEGEKQHLKNQNSKRKVPVHPKLIELGFIDFVNEQKKNKQQLLFNKLSYSPKNKYNKKMSAWFARYLEEIGITQESKVFHSFRHLVKQSLRNYGVPKEFQNAICGWSGDDIGEKVYGGEVPIEILYKEICKLKYPVLEKSLEQLKNR